MLYRKQDSIAFLLVPRNGSTSLRELLIGSGFKHPLIFADLEYGFFWHPTYRDCVGAYPALSNYSMYGVFRDPVDRFTSAIRLVINQTERDTELTASSYEQVIEKLFSWKHEAPPRKHGSMSKDVLSEIFKPQADWLDGPNVSVIRHAEFSERVSEIVGVSKDQTGRRINASDGARVMSEQTIEFVKRKYANDYAFAEKLGLTA